MLAAFRHALVAGLQQLGDARVRVVALGFHDLRANEVAGKAAFDEHHVAVVASDSGASLREVVHPQLEQRSGGWAERLGGSGGHPKYPGMRVFEDIDWSTERVMSQTRERLREVGWTWAELETLWDVDRPEDYERLVASSPEFRGNHSGVSPSHIG